MKALCTWMVAVLFVSVLAGCGSGEKEGPNIKAELKKAMAITDPSARARNLVKVANKQREAGDAVGAKSTLNTAAAAAEEVSDAASKAGTLVQVGASLLKGGDLSAGKDVLKKAEKVAETIEDPAKKAPVLAELAVAYQKENADKANYLLTQARETATSITDSEQKGTALARLGDALVRADMKDEAKKVVADVADLARALEGKRKQADGLMDAALLAAKVDPELSAALIAEAEQAADAETDAYSKGHAWLSIAKKFAAAGKKADARTRVDKAMDLSDKVKSQSEREELRDEANKLKATL